MKKLNLKTVKNSLKRDELRNVKGGSGADGQCYMYNPRCTKGLMSALTYRCCDQWY